MDATDQMVASLFTTACRSCNHTGKRMYSWNEMIGIVSVGNPPRKPDYWFSKYNRVLLHYSVSIATAAATANISLSVVIQNVSLLMTESSMATGCDVTESDVTRSDVIRPKVGLHATSFQSGSLPVTSLPVTHA
jgi:hypothetical protein